MTKLGTPLPYDYVDQLLDEQFKFYEPTPTEMYGEKGLVRFSASRNGGTGYNVPRLMIQLNEDVPPRHYDRVDDEGYMDRWGGGSDAMYWTAKELTEEEIEAELLD